MTIEELALLKADVQDDYDAWTILPNTSKTGIACLELIDAEIARQSVTDYVEDVQEAINLVETIGIFSVDENVMPYPYSIEKIITDALRQYRKPEPCMWCPSYEPEKTKNEDGTTTWRIGCNYCPNCGRKLEGEGL